MRFFLVDRVDEIIPGELARGVKNVTMSEDFLAQHFPGHPIYPGTLLLESLAQLGGFLAEATVNREPEAEPRRAVLAQVDKAKFHEPSRPGDQIMLEVRVLSAHEGAAQLEATASVRGQKAASARLTYVLRTIDAPRVHEERREVYRTWTRHLALSFEIR